MPLEDPREPLAFWLQRRGMLTAAVANDRQSEFLDPRFVGRGFDRFVDVDRAVGSSANDRDITDVAIEMLDSLPADQPYFLWVHYFGPHKPDERHARIPDFGTSPGARYDHEVAFNDRELRRLLSAIESDARGQNTAIFITADHGEQIRGQWRGHGGNVHESSIRIPLLMKLPGLGPGRVKTPVSLVDVFPTILEVTQTEGPATDGMALTKLVQSVGTDRVLFAETWRFDARGAITNDRVAAFDGTVKLERDNLRDIASLQTQRRSRRARNGSYRRREARLQQRLDAYLEENGAVDMHD
jgi:arylsulfatase A-like enzyme